MTRVRAWPARLMYALIAAALAMSLMIMAAPAHKVGAVCTADVCAEWERVSTPTMDGFVVAPLSTIIDYALADGGDVAYAVVHAYDEDYAGPDYRLLKSEDGAATWKDITRALEDVDDDGISSLLHVATDWVDPDFVAVALVEANELRVYISTDGGDKFINAGEVEDDGVSLGNVSDLAVSPEAGGKRDIAIGGQNATLNATLFRCTVTGKTPGAWVDTFATYQGEVSSWTVADIIFSPSWATDKTILITTVAEGNTDEDIYLQFGSWGTSPGWNTYSTLGIDAILLKDEVDIPSFFEFDLRGIAGIALPSDYNSKNTDKRVLWVWVNHNPIDDVRCQLLRVDNDDADLVGPLGQIVNGKVWIANIAYYGTIAEGKAIAGLIGNGTYEIADCCVGVQVYRNDGIRNMDICCERWSKACKPPTGSTAMAVSYVSEDKAYAVALYGFMGYDEGAWSVSFDDGDTWNQLSLIDTYIDYFSDVAVSPDCNKMFLASVNLEAGCGCDSVWVTAEEFPEAGYSEYSGKWLRTWCGELEGAGILRLNPEEDTGDTVYLFDYGTSNVYRNDLETLACWDPIPCTALDNIVDLAVKDADTVYALDYDGAVAMFDVDEWSEAVDSKVDEGWTIALHGDYILIGGQDGDACYANTADAEEWADVTFTALKDVASEGFVTVAFDTYFDQNDVIYAALAGAGEDNNGIYMLEMGAEPEKWHKLNAEPYDYTGLVTDRVNPYTSPETGGVLYASYSGSYGEEDGCEVDNGDGPWDTGVARCLAPIYEVCCGVGEGEWDYLTIGLSGDERFEAMPDALKICGCLAADSNSKLFAIDSVGSYDMDEGLDASVWTFEDCYAKKAVELKSPVDGFVVPADPCACCNSPFSIKWDRLCDACIYEVQFARDEEFTDIVAQWDCVKPLAPRTPSEWVGCEESFVPGATFYWRVRAIEAETDQDIKSWWSEPRTFTVAPTAAQAEIKLVSPVPGALNVPPKNTAFSWSLLADADKFDWVLSKNADLSSPVESKTGLTRTAYTCTKTLDYDTTYYWQVTAYNGGSAISVSPVGTFTTAAAGKYCCPQCGLCYNTQAELQEHAKTHEVTPFWVWVVIAIGAVLVIVVIVLIFRTRRV